MQVQDHAVVVVGGGPAGMMLAAELAIAGVDVAIVEQRPNHELAGSRAGGFHARTIEVLDQRGVADRFLAEGSAVQAAAFGSTPLDMSDFPTRHPYSLGIFQNKIEQIMGAWIDELSVRTYNATAVTGFTQDESGVEAQLAGGGSLRAQYLVGCDGGRSLIRKLAGIEFPGLEATRSTLIAEVEVSEETPPGVHLDSAGAHGLQPLADGKTVRIVTSEQQLATGETPTLQDLKNSLQAAFGTDFGVHDPTWISRFTDATRQAASYRAGRVLLAGDSAHIHYPAGGQGLSLGVQDAVNLGWKLARVIHGTSPESLLDSYHAERHPVAQRALKYTIAQALMQRRDERTQMLAEILSEVIATDQARRQLAGLHSGLDVHYDLGEGHPLLGRRMPDLDLEDGSRVFELLHDATPLLLSFGQPLSSDRVRVVEAGYGGRWELPVLGEVSAPGAVLIRPDGYVAWVGEGSDSGLSEALNTWF